MPPIILPPLNSWDSCRLKSCPDAGWVGRKIIALRSEARRESSGSLINGIGCAFLTLTLIIVNRVRAKMALTVSQTV